MGSLLKADLSLEEISKRLATIYKDVIINRNPLYRWMNILNDATILAEEVRRNNAEKGVMRAGKILMRLLEFIGYYMYINRENGTKYLSEIMQNVMNEVSYNRYYNGVNLEEGPSRWIYAKYPLVCAKCGESPCACVVSPWIFEERRENPESFEIYKLAVERKRLNLKNIELSKLTFEGLFDFFNMIYRNTYYNNDSWKVALHFTEELGEATIELSRLELICNIKNRQSYIIPYEEIQKQLNDKINDIINKINDSDPLKDTIIEKYNNESVEVIKRIRSDPHNDYITSLIGIQFKEEIADVFSWLVAVIIILNGFKKKITSSLLNGIIDNYNETSGRHKIECPYCHNETCSDDCLISHAIANELLGSIHHQ